MLFILVLGAVIWWFQPDLKQSKWAPLIPALPANGAASSVVKAMRYPAGTPENTIAPKKGPYFVLTYLNDLSFSVVPANSDFYELDSFTDQKFEISLQNFQEFDSVQMWGSDNREFLPANVVFDWTQKELDRATFEPGFFKQHRFYRLQWNSLLKKESRKAHFFFSAEKSLSPGFKITYQPIDKGTVVADLTYVLSPGGEGKSQLSKLQLRQNSVLGFKFDLSRHQLFSCEYAPPNGGPKDCAGWVDSDYIGSVGVQDVGWHRIHMNTDKGQFSFEVEISQIH